MGDLIRKTLVDQTKRPPQRPSEKFSPTRLFADHAFAARMWFLIACATLLVCLAQPFLLLSSQRSKERVVVLDGSGTFSISPLLGFEEAKDLHEAMALWAALALFSRNPKNFDYPELLQRLYLTESYNKAEADQTKSRPEFSLKNIHQKPEVFKVETLRTRENQILTKVEGQLIRTGIFEGQSFSESLKFTLNITFVRNPDMLANKRFPLGVWKFDYTVY